jgi:integrase
MSTVFYRNGQCFYQGRKDGRQVKKALGTDNLKVAESLQRKIDKESGERPIPEPPKAILLTDMLAKYKSDLKIERRAKSINNDMGRLMIFIGHNKIHYFHQITLQMVREFMKYLVSNGRTNNTANKYRQNIYALFKYAIDNQDYFSLGSDFLNPISSVKPYKVPDREIVYLKSAEIDKLLLALESNSGIRAAAATMIFAGLRRAELLCLTKDEVVLDHANERGCIRIRSKIIGAEICELKTSGSIRNIPISKRLYPILKAHESTLKPNIPWYFPSPSYYSQWDFDNFSTHLRNLQKSSEKSWNCLHFRHSFATHLASKGVALFKVAKLMGNTVNICEKYYAAFFQEENSDIVDF